MAGPGPMLDAGLDESASAPLDPDAEQPEAHAAFLMGASTIHAIRGLGTDPSCGGPMYAQSACSLEALSRAVEAPTLQTHPPIGGYPVCPRWTQRHPGFPMCRGSTRRRHQRPHFEDAAALR